jgi:IS5 family transposase
VLEALQDEPLAPPLREATELLATVLGQDLEDGPDGRIRIARWVAPDRVISTVDPEARHGHKTSAHGFDGYKGHLAIDPDAEIVTATAVTPGNVGDATAVGELLASELASEANKPLTVYGDSAYGTGATLEALGAAGAELRLKVAPPTAPAGRFTKADFAIDLEHRTATCPAGRTVRLGRSGASFGRACGVCPLLAHCTSSRQGRSISVGPHEAALQRARAAERDPGWRDDYRATRPKVERKIAHLVRHGGRRARVRGRAKVGADFALLAAGVNLARFAVLGLFRSEAGWAVAAT